MNSWFASEIVWVRAGVMMLVANAAFVLLASRLHRRFDRVTDVLLSISVTAIGVGIGLRWHQNGQGPFLTLYEILISNVFSLGLFFMLACLIAPTVRNASSVALSLLAFLGVWATLVPTEATPLPPTFDNPWLWVHVLAGKLFLGAALVATALSVHLLLLDPGRKYGPSTANVEDLDAQVWRFAALAFVFDSGMLVAGAAWARDAWGRYWAWDPLETWALLTWLVLGLVLHARVGLRLPRWPGWIGICAVFILAFLTFFGVPFLSFAPHKGVM